MLHVYEVGGGGELTAGRLVADALGLGRHGRIRLWVAAASAERAARLAQPACGCPVSPRRHVRRRESPDREVDALHRRAAGAELVLAHAWPARVDAPIVQVGTDGAVTVVGRMAPTVPVCAGCGWVRDAGGCLCAPIG